MARPLRIQYPGAFYHVTNRGNERKPIFKDDVDRARFLEILSQSLGIYQVVLHAFVMMTNHYHLLVETPLGNLAEFMRHFNITYTSHFNRQHNRVGHLFQGRYKSVLVDKDSYLVMLSKYIHLNPVKVRGMLTKPVPEQVAYLTDYRWSSLPGYINSRGKVDFVEYGQVLSVYGGANASGRKRYLAQLQADLAGELNFKKEIVGQSILGSADFVAWVKEHFLAEKKERELPSTGRICSYIPRDKILELLSDELGMSATEIVGSKGMPRQLAMDLLYRFGGMTNPAIGVLMGVDYSTVSQGRKRLAEKRAKDKKLNALVSQLEVNLSRIKI